MRDDQVERIKLLSEEIADDMVKTASWQWELVLAQTRSAWE
jgi:hypothetical protein